MRSGTRKPVPAKRLVRVPSISEDSRPDGVNCVNVGNLGAMLQQATDAAGDERPAVPAPRSKEQPLPVDPEMFNFADIEHFEVEQAELDAAAASWDGFL